MTLLDAGGLIFLITINAVSIGTPKITLGKSTKEKERKANLHLIFAKKKLLIFTFSLQPYVPHRAPFTVFSTNRI